MNILIVGVGGQGTLLASRVLGRAKVDEGFDVKASEVHGMAQRGGSVVTFVKYGEKVYSPVIERGEADFILAFEEMEAYRWLPYLKKGGKLIVNTQKIYPMPVIVGAAEYPNDIIEKIKGMGIDMFACDALSVASAAGSEKSVNVVLLGVLSAAMGEDEERFLEAVKKTVPQKLLDVNIEAFTRGRSLCV